ncbi:ProQ/FINO family protein [Aquitalea aquatica]|uniref:ProQ/FINO family protein n=1 Tax=Aquitalea aquatica TaxID=3044273 RepID=A0A838Y394_9NEIS|nr:ProQ/FINO family protein [Aquitalea magnusonii]MBA4707802.1 ProQ/FINO family protein [Aquitalea magnusonii]
MKPNTETALGAALKSAVQSLSKKKQTEMIAEHVYSKFEVFRQFRPLALGIHESLIAALTQFDPTLISRVVANHCRKPRYVKSLARGGKRFDLAGKPTGEVTAEEKKAAQLMSAPKAAVETTAVPEASTAPVTPEGQSAE